MSDAIDSDPMTHSPLRFSALMLAAGTASRLGGRPKGLLELDGRPLVGRLADALKQVGAAETVAILGPHAGAFEAALAPSGVRCIVNPQPQEGQIASQRLGLRALSDESQAVMILLCDQPLIGVPQLEALIRAYLQRPPGTEMVQPHVQGLPGNPVLLSQTVRRQILAAGPETGGRQWQQTHPEQVHAWSSDDPAYRVDVDTMQDLQALRSTLNLRWPAWLQDPM